MEFRELNESVVKSANIAFNTLNQSLQSVSELNISAYSLLRSSFRTISKIMGTTAGSLYSRKRRQFSIWTTDQSKLNYEWLAD